MVKDPIILGIVFRSSKKGKKYEYCIAKGQVGKEYMVENCWTKARDNKKRIVKATKQAEVEEASSDDNNKIRIEVVRVKLG